MSTALFSFFGIIVGAALQYLFTRHLDNQKHHRELRTKAYTDYLTCVSEHAHLGRPRHSQESRELFARTTDAKCRICLYGSSLVIEAFAAFETLGAVVKTDEQRAAITGMVALMRSDSESGEQVKLPALEVVLLGAKQES